MYTVFRVWFYNGVCWYGFCDNSVYFKNVNFKNLGNGYKNK